MRRQIAMREGGLKELSHRLARYAATATDKPTFSKESTLLPGINERT